MKKLTLILLILTFFSCNFGKNGITAEIKNSSEKTIRNVIFSSDENTKLEFEKIEPNQTVKKFLDMTNNHKGDGAYELRFERENGKTEQTPCGYYTKGGSLDRKVTFEIKNDFILIKFSGIVY